MAESEIKNFESNQNSSPHNEITVNHTGPGKIIVNTGDNSKQEIGEVTVKESNKKLMGVITILIPFFAFLFYVIAEWDNVVKFFKHFV